MKKTISSGGNQRNVGPGPGDELEAPISSLETIRAAWSKMNLEAKDHENDLPGELEEYLRCALFRGSGLVHSLRNADELIKKEARVRVAAEFDTVLAVCEQVALYLLQSTRQ